MKIVIDARIRRASTGRPVDRLLEHLQKLDNENKYTVLLESDDDWKPTAKNFRAVPCRFKQFSMNPLNQLLFARQLNKLNADLVHFTLTGTQPLLYFGRQITMTHDLTMFKHVRKKRGMPRWLHWLRMKGYRLLVWSAHRRAEHIIVPTQYVRDAVAKLHLFTNRKITVAYEAGDPPLDIKAQKPENFTASPYLLYVGSAFPHKNLRRLVMAYEQIKLAHPTLKLILVGKQERFAKQLQRWVKKRGSKDVEFAGFVTDGELKWLYQNASLYVFPSLSEGFGLPGLEAMAHGCPVASSSATCLPEVYGDSAHYFDPEDVDDMAQKINEMLGKESLRKQLIEAGHKQVKKYSWERFTQQNLDVYKQVLGG